MHQHPFSFCLSKLQSTASLYFDLSKLNDPRVKDLPTAIKILLECAVRNCDGVNIRKQDIESILNWSVTSTTMTQIPFKPSRVILQDLTGVPLVVDLAALRDGVARLGGQPATVNPECPVDLVIDHSVQVDFARTPDSLAQNQEREFERNRERFEFLKWGQSAFQNFTIVPPGFGIVHQVNLQYLARVVFQRNNLVYPDTVVGTDSHTTMINGLGVLGWGVGGIQAQAVMLGQCTSMVLPQVIGFKLTNRLPPHATATDLVLLCTQMLRKRGVVDKFVQFYGQGVRSLSLADRATVSNMAPQYGATVGLFPIDDNTLLYLAQTGRTAQHIALVKEYLTKQGLMADYTTESKYSSTLELDLSTVQPCVSGPKRPHDYVALNKLKSDWNECLTREVGFKGYGLKAEEVERSAVLHHEAGDFVIRNGAVVIAAITSCTNTSNPGVMLAAGLLCRKAVELKLRVKPYIKTSLSPGSQAVSRYLEQSNLTDAMNSLGFYHAGYGCMTCIGNSGDISKELEQLLKQSDLCVASVLSGNRNFQGRVHPVTKANFLASPPLVVAFALAGTVNINFQTQPLSYTPNGDPVYLKDIWPSQQQIRAIEQRVIRPDIFLNTYSKLKEGTDRWNNLPTKHSILFPWNAQSTYIHDPPFFKEAGVGLPVLRPIVKASVLALFGDSITTDHVSPAGNIATGSPAARFLKARGIEKRDFNTYGARRGNDLIMARGTFANIRLSNAMMGKKQGPQTVHVPSGEVMDIFDAAERYREQGIPLIIVGGKEYGSGSSRDWAAKGPFLLGVCAVIAESFERIHRSNLIGMGVLPLTFLPGESATTHHITGYESFDIVIDYAQLVPNEEVRVVMSNGHHFQVRSSLKTEVEITYFKNKGILPFVLRKQLSGK